MCPISAVSCIALNVTQFEASRGFFIDVWGLVPVGETEERLDFSAAAGSAPLVSLYRSDRDGLAYIQLKATSREAVDKLHKRAVQMGCEVSGLVDDDHGYSFSLTDFEGRTIKVTCPPGKITTVPEQASGLSCRLSHIVLNTRDLQKAADFYVALLDMRVSDWSEDKMVFLRASSEHHCLAFNLGEVVSLNHAAFEVPSIDALMRCLGRLRKFDALTWGPGRHGPGDNVFLYCLGPSNFVVEYTAEIQYVDEDTHKAKVWERKPELLDQWGTAGMPPEKLRACMTGASLTGSSA
ncbi:VOC family protein [Pusillimonas noertemannii]|uniref:VOC family protein n=1 Tax=Pusillimonas noertemannii TaxID=305977 RepID=UPI00333FFBFB